MVSLRIKNIGPVKDSGIIQLTSFLLLIGRQSSGKSTFMKVLCYCRWLEKHIMTSTEDIVTAYTHNQKFLKELKQFHRMNDDFFSKESLIEYVGDTLSITLTGDNGNPKILRNADYKESRFNSKLCFIPAERNLITAVKDIDKAYKSSERDVLFNFVYEWDEGKNHYDAAHPMRLSVTDSYQYINDAGNDKILMPNGKPILEYYASSGLQSVAPIDVLSDYVTGCVGTSKKFTKNDLSLLIMEYLNGVNGGQKTIDASTMTEDAIKEISKRLIYQSSQLFIEEPEQNLYPDSQKLLVLNLIKRLVKANKTGEKDSSIVLTTHSPYVLSVLNVLMSWATAVEKKQDSEELMQMFSLDLLLASEQYSAYYIDETGTFRNIKDAEIPMFSGNELDGVSDWVEEKISAINNIVYE